MALSYIDTDLIPLFQRVKPLALATEALLRCFLIYPATVALVDLCD